MLANAYDKQKVCEEISAQFERSAAKYDLEEIDHHMTRVYASMDPRVLPTAFPRA